MHPPLLLEMNAEQLHGMPPLGIPRKERLAMDIEVTVIMDDGTRTMPVRSRMPLSAFVDTILQNERTETLIAR